MESLKILHRIYFGFDGKPDSCIEYLKIWEEKLPNYKIMHWNANNLPIDICEYTQKLYNEKDHTFLSDYFRWWVLREYGGIYLDADIEIVNGGLFNSLIEELEISNEYHSFIGIESSQYNTYTAHSMACKKNSPLAQFMCSIYENIGILHHFRKEALFLAPFLTRLYFYDKNIGIQSKGFINIQKPMIIEGVKIYPQEYFSPLNYGESIQLNKELSLDNTCLCHHFNGSWLDNANRSNDKQQKMLSDYIKEQEQEQKYTNSKILRILKKIISFSLKITKKIFKFIFSIPSKIKNA